MANREEIASTLQRILASAEFSRAKRMSRFLQFVVEETLSERVDNLKERQIGIDVFDLPVDWDPKLNNIVRGEARRLRSKLESYYETIGKDESVRISIPRGAYGAEFALTQHEESGELPSDHALPPAGLVPHAPLIAGSRQISLRIAALLSCIGAIFVFFFALTWRNSAKAGEDSFEVLPFAYEIGQEFSPSVSPDGQRVAYVWDGNDDNYDIYIKNVRGGGLSRLTHDPSPDLDPVWSPDGKSIAFLRVSKDRIHILLQDLSGGSEHLLTSTENMISGWGADSNPYFGCYGPAWSSDGSKIILSDRGSAGHGFSLYAYSLKSGMRAELTHPAGEARDICPHFSPDGQHIAFARLVSHGVGDIHIASADGKEERQLTFDRSTIQGLNWLNSGEEILFSSLRHGSQQLRLVSSQGGVQKQLPVTATSALSPSLAPSGEWLAFTALEDNWNIWRAPVTAAGMGKPELFLSSTGKNHSPVYSPDGRKIAFVSDRLGTPELWVADANGTDLHKLTSFGGPWLGSIRWSPDSQQLVFDARPDGHAGIFILRLDNTRPVAFKDDQFEERRPTWSHDGRTIYFNSNRDGSLRIWKRSLDGGNPVPIGPPGTNESAESTDGSTLYFTNGDYELWKCKTDGSAVQRLPINVPLNPGLDWSLGPRGIYFAGDQNGQPAFFHHSLSSGDTRMIGHPGKPFAPGTPSLTVSPDGKWILYAQLDHVSTDIKIRRSIPSSEKVRSAPAY